MKISVSTGGLLDEYLPPGTVGDTVELEVSEGTTLPEVLDLLGIPQSENVLLSVNGQLVTRSERNRYVLNHYDALTILPPLKGG